MDWTTQPVMAHLSAWAAALILAGVMLTVWAIGWWWEKRFIDDHGDAPDFKFDDACIAILGLLLAFTFSLALSKHDQRRLMVVSEANSIGDFYTCASLLPEPTGSRMREAIRAYAKLRVDFVRDMEREASDKVLAKGMTDSLAGQAELTRLTAEALAAGTPIAVNLVNTLNNVSSAWEARVTASRDHLPGPIVFLLFGTSVGMAILIGRQQAAMRTPRFASSVFFILLVSLLVFITLDLNQPLRGFITVSQEPMLRLLISIAP